MRLELRSIRAGLAVALSITLAACAAGSPPPQARGPEPRIRGYVDVGLANQASAFEAFTRKASAISPGFSDPGDIASGLQTGAGFEPRQLQSGMIAYAAMAALQEPAFVAGLRKGGGRDLARQLAANPDAALSLPGGQAAAARANAALHRRGETLASAGARVKQTAYSVQRQPWSRARVPNAAARLSQAKRMGAAGYQRADGDTARLYMAVTEGGRRGGASPIVSRGVALAALTVLGQEGQGRALMTEPRSGLCLKMAKLNFHQCLASAGTHYEDIYCLGVHAMAETGQCVVAATKQAPSVRRAAL